MRISSVKPVFCRFVLPCQIVIPPIKTVGSKFFINVYTYPNPKPTPYSNADALNIVVQREKKDEILKSDG